jgi:hypothetical protein
MLNEINDVQTFSDYLERIETVLESGNEYTLFRGQSTNKSLLPSIARKDPKYNSTHKEKIMLSELKRRGGYIANIDGKSEWDLMVFAQHHEMQTRLLDWSSNPLIALWFACQNEFMMNEDSFVYTLATSEEFVVNQEKDKSPWDITKTMILKPSLNNGRIIAQAGWFTVHRYSKKAKKFIALERNTEIGGMISRIRIPAASKEMMLERLSTYGVRSSTIFPDIIGLCKHMNWKFRNNNK